MNSEWQDVLNIDIPTGQDVAFYDVLLAVCDEQLATAELQERQMAMQQETVATKQRAMQLQLVKAWGDADLFNDLAARYDMRRVYFEIMPLVYDHWHDRLYDLQQKRVEIQALRDGASHEAGNE